jgi:3-hydroxyisobutyrate dehydrogenase-like beta-hydroxyacid dehydrogenase
MLTIAWIGLGLIGRPMSNHMRAAGQRRRGAERRSRRMAAGGNSET